jgi:hypothetical protein
MRISPWLTCLLTEINPKNHGPTVNGTEIESTHTCCTLVIDSQRAKHTQLYPRQYTRDQPCRLSHRRTTPSPPCPTSSLACEYQHFLFVCCPCFNPLPSFEPLYCCRGRIKSLLSSPNRWAPCCVMTSNGIGRLNSEGTCLCLRVLELIDPELSLFPVEVDSSSLTGSVPETLGPVPSKRRPLKACIPPKHSSSDDCLARLVVRGTSCPVVDPDPT